MGKGRAPCCDKTKVRTGPWSPTEDLRLMEFVLKNGHSNWRSLPKQAGLLRCGKSCRLRWVNYLRPDVKRGHFTAQEEETIIKLYNSFGKKWSKIASYLPGRTDNEIKNVWNTHLKKRVMNMKNNIGEDGQGINSEMDISGVSSSRDENTDILFSSVQESSPKLTSINPSDHHNEPKQTAVSNFDNFSPEKAVGYSESDNATYPQGDSSDNGIIEIPSDYDFWELLDSLEPLQLINKTAYNGSGSGSGEQDSNITLTDRASFDGEDSVGKWLRSLEDELGLTREYDADHLHMDQNRVTASPPYQEMNNFETPEISLAFDYYSIWPCSPQYHDI